MKFKRAWVLVSSLGLGLGLVGYAGGCGDDGSAGGNGGAGGTGGAGGMPSGSGVSSSGTGMTNDGSWLAMECETDSDCGNAEGATCVAATDDDAVFMGGPSNGYCSKKCQKSGDCPGESSICVKAGADTEGRCVLGCTIGPKSNDLDAMLDPEKCHGRDDLRCSALSNGSTVCLPGCGNDGYCPSGMVCDLRYNVCKAMAYPGKGLGQTCDPAAMTPECSAICIPDPSGKGLCTAQCVRGGDMDDCGGLDKGACLFTPNKPADVGAGDIGFCTAACTAQEDCANPMMWCAHLNGLPPEYGYCVPGLPSCNTQADCDAKIATKELPPGFQCIDTPSGKVCLDPSIPVTHGGGGGGGAGGSGGMGGAGGGGGAGGM